MAQTLAKIKDGGAYSGGDQEGKELGVRRCGGHLRLWSPLTQCPGRLVPSFR